VTRHIRGPPIVIPEHERIQEVSKLEGLAQASIVALASILMGVVPLAMGIVYLVWPSEQRLALMRPCPWPRFLRYLVARRLVW